MAPYAPLPLPESERLYAHACTVIAGGTTRLKQPDIWAHGRAPAGSPRCGRAR